MGSGTGSRSFGAVTASTCATIPRGWSGRGCSPRRGDARASVRSSIASGATKRSRRPGRRLRSEEKLALRLTPFHETGKHLAAGLVPHEKLLGRLGALTGIQEAEQGAVLQVF